MKVCPGRDRIRNEAWRPLPRESHRYRHKIESDSKRERPAEIADLSWYDGLVLFNGPNSFGLFHLKQQLRELIQ